MKELRKYLYELEPHRLREKLNLFWRINIHPPKESKIFLPPEKVSIITEKVDVKPTKKQPKQVVYDANTQQIFVSCMEGRCLQVFILKKNKILLAKEIPFSDQCVEVLAANSLLFVTTTNFDRSPRELRNKLWILDINSLKIISNIDTGGNWSKLIAINPQGTSLLVSNWYSHDISVIDISNPKTPMLKQVVKWGEAPRGIAFLPDGVSAMVTGFYSGNLGILKKLDNEQWSPIFTSDPFDQPSYHGNMRHVLITNNGKVAIISNLGRNLVHLWDIKKRQFLNSISVGKSPNSMDILENELIAVSCRDSASVYIVKTQTQQVIGRSVTTGKEPTGLCAIPKGFLVTCFGKNTIELHHIISG